MISFKSELAAEILWVSAAFLCLRLSGVTLVVPSVRENLIYYLFRYRSLFFLYSRPCLTVLVDLFLLAKILSSNFSVQKHQFHKVASMKFLVFDFSLMSSQKSCFFFQKSCYIFPEILFLWDENVFK